MDGRTTGSNETNQASSHTCFWPDENGTSSVSYAVLAGLGALAIGAFTSLGDGATEAIAGTSNGAEPSHSARPGLAGSGLAGSAWAAEIDGSSFELPHETKRPFGDVRRSNERVTRGGNERASRGGNASASRVGNTSGSRSLLTQAVDSSLDLFGRAVDLGTRVGAAATIDARALIPSAMSGGNGSGRRTDAERQRWSFNPVGTKPVTAWNFGDALKALLTGFLIPEEPSSLAGTPLYPQRNSTFASTSLNAFNPLQQTGPANTSRIKALNTQISDHHKQRESLQTMLSDLRKLSKAGAGDFGDLRTSLNAAISDIDTLLTLHELERATRQWSEEHPGYWFDQQGLGMQMGPFGDDGPLADVRNGYLSGELDREQALALMLEIAGTPHHDAAVQLALLQSSDELESLARELETALSADFSINGVAGSLQEHVKRLGRGQGELRAEYQALAEERGQLMAQVGETHSHASHGISTKAWDKYLAQRDRIRELTNRMNELREGDAAISDKVDAFNKLVASTSVEGYQAPQTPGRLDKVSNPDFLSTRPEGTEKVRAFRNGEEFSIQVVQLAGKPVEVNTARAYKRMAADAQRDGVHLDIVSGFRTHDEQVHLYGCYKSGSCNNGNQAAPPGYSNHQSGHALDLNSHDRGSAQYRWLNANAHRYGFSETVAGEPWHWEHW